MRTAEKQILDSEASRATGGGDGGQGTHAWDGHIGTPGGGWGGRPEDRVKENHLRQDGIVPGAGGIGKGKGLGTARSGWLAGRPWAREGLIVPHVRVMRVR